MQTDTSITMPLLLVSALAYAIALICGKRAAFANSDRPSMLHQRFMPSSALWNHLQSDTGPKQSPFELNPPCIGVYDCFAALPWVPERQKPDLEDPPGYSCQLTVESAACFECLKRNQAERSSRHGAFYRQVPAQYMQRKNQTSATGTSQAKDLISC